MPKKHPYYNKQAAMMATMLLRDWGAKGYATIIIQPRFLHMTPQSLRQKLRHGLKFLMDSLENSEHLAYWDDINSKLVIKDQGDNMHLIYQRSAVDARTFEDVDGRVNLRAALNAWVASPRIYGDRWPEALPPFKLNDDDVAYFRQRIIDLAPKGFVGLVTKETIRFVYAPME